MKLFSLSILAAVALSVSAAPSVAKPAVSFAPNWGYGALEGKWGKINECCATGKDQSPINFQGDTFTLTSGTPVCEWTPTFYGPVTLNDEGSFLQILFDQIRAKQQTSWNGHAYYLDHADVHSPSEHHVDGQWYDLEVQLFHYTDAKKKTPVILSIFFNVGDQPSSWLGQFIDGEKEPTPGKPLTIGTSKTIFHNFKFPDSVNSCQFYGYTGSLTYPPCTEQIQWFVAKDVFSVSLKQFEFLSLNGKRSDRENQANN
ncbi:alpha carbonic anhydrase [Chytriomyces sp. MP71]|nr:alpha carbonic anhydrase [Chytriomyces sp. MP71]